MFQFTHPVWGATDGNADCYSNNQFQFTHPVWGATKIIGVHRSTVSRFNSRTPCGVRRGLCYGDELVEYVSIHAPRVGCDATRVTV